MEIKLIETERFIRKANKIIKKNKYLDGKLESVLNKLVSNPFHISLKTHKLKGNLSKLYAASVTQDLRIIFQFVEEEGQLCILLVTIGKHDDVY